MEKSWAGRSQLALGPTAIAAVKHWGGVDQAAPRVAVRLSIPPQSAALDATRILRRSRLHLPQGAPALWQEPVTVSVLPDAASQLAEQAVKTVQVDELPGVDAVDDCSLVAAAGTTDLGVALPRDRARLPLPARPDRLAQSRRADRTIFRGDAPIEPSPLPIPHGDRRHRVDHLHRPRVVAAAPKQGVARLQLVAAAPQSASVPPRRQREPWPPPIELRAPLEKRGR